MVFILKTLLSIQAEETLQLMVMEMIVELKEVFYPLET